MIGKPRVWIPALAFLVTLLAIGTSGFLLFKHYSSEIKSAAQEELAEVTDLKVRQIVRWLDDQRRDAEVISRDNLLAEEVERWFQQGAPEGVMAQKILARLASLAQVNQYERIALLDEKARPRLPVAADQNFDPHDANLALQAMRENTVTRSDLNWSDKQKPEMDMVAPLAVPGTEGPRVIGAVHFHIDPTVFFFPYIQFWPTPGGETLLVRRDGNEVLFLSELRHRKDAALKLRLPMDQPLLVAAMALRGKDNVMEGVDYRGVPVIAAARKVPGTPWVLVSKLDRAKIEASLRGLAATAGGLAALFVLLAGAIATVWWRKQHAQYLVALSEEKLQRQALEQHFDYATKLARDIILLYDETGRLVECNDSALAAYGYTREELLSLTLSKLRAAPAVAAIPGDLERAARTGGATFETEHRRKDGSTFPVEVSMRRIEIEGRRFYQSIVRDITERKNQQERIARLNRIYVVLSAINSAIIHIRDPKALASEACRIAVELGGYLTANIFLIDRDSRVARAVGHAGIQKSLYEALEIDLDRPPMEGDGPLRILFRTGKHVVEAVGKEGAEGKPVSRALQRGLKAGFHSMAAFPLLISEGQVIGALQLSSAHPNAFDEEEVRLLLQLTADAALGFNHIEKEKQIGESEERFRATFAQAGVGMGLRAADPRNPRWLRVNQKLCDILGYTREELLQLTTVDLTPPEERQLAIDYNEQLISGDLDSYAREKQYVRKDGTLIWTSISLSAVRGPDGRPTHIISVITDITERKQAEERVQKFSHMVEQSPAPMVITDTDGHIEYVNPKFSEISGYAPEELIGKTPDVIQSGLTPPEVYQDLWRTILAGGEWRGELQNRKKNGELYWEDEIISALKNDRGEIVNFIAVKEDITERKQAAEALQKEYAMRLEAERELLRAQESLADAARLEAVGRLAAGVAHEVKNPLTVVRLGVDYLAKQSPQDSNPEVIDDIRTAIDRAERVIRDLLDFSKQRPFDRRPIDINQVIDNALQLVKHEIESRKLAIVRTRNDPLPPIYADPDRLAQVFINLLSNAAHAIGKDGRIEVTTRAIRVSGRDLEQAGKGIFSIGEPVIMIDISDSGPGIPAEIEQKLFQPFFTTKPEGEGSGLGLAVSHGIVVMHKGSISIFNRPEGGASARLMFRVARE